MHIFGTEIDLNGNEFKHLRPENLLSFPVTPTTGQIIMHTGLGSFYGYNGAIWLDLALGGGGSYSLPTASDIILGGVKIDGTTITIDGSGVISANFTDPALVIQDDGNGNGYALSDRDAAKYSNIGFGAVDLTVNGVGEVDTDYGVESELGFSTGSANKLPAGASNYGTHQAHGYGNIVQGYYNNMAYGTYNTITNGYSAVTIGYSNTMNMTATVGHGCSIGGFNDSSSFWNNVFGFRLIGKSKGATIVGIGNTDYVTTSGTGRPAFVVGVGDADSNTGVTYGDIISRADGLVMNYAGELSLPTAYGSGATTGVPAYSLSVDSSGNVIESALSQTLDQVTDNGNVTTNQVYLGKVWTSNIQNNDTGNLTISGNQGLILRNYNPNDGEVLITANGLLSALTDNEATWTTRMSRSFTDSLTTANNKFWGMYINDTIDMTSKTGSPYYSAIYIAPSVTGGGDIRSIYSLEGNALFEQGYVQADDFRLNALNTAPSGASDTGTLGEIRVDASYIYVCTATNTWKRVAIATW